MATKREPDLMDENKPDTVTVQLPLLSGEPDTVFVGLNGKGYRVQRGVSVELPAPVAAILEESEARKQAKQKRIRDLQNGVR